MSVAELSGIDRGKGGGSTVQGAAGSQEHGVQESWGTRSAIHGDILLCVQTEREIMTGDRRKGGRSARDRGAEGPTGRRAEDRALLAYFTDPVGRRPVPSGERTRVLGVPRGLSGRGKVRKGSGAAPSRKEQSYGHHFCNGD